MIYSPKPPEDYRIQGIILDFQQLERSQFPTECWNLYWLAHTGVDKLIEPSLDPWWKGFKTKRGLATSIVLDVYGTPALRYWLQQSPLEFANWWLTHPPASVTLCKLYPSSREIVAERALKAAKGIHGEQLARERKIPCNWVCPGMRPSA